MIEQQLRLIVVPPVVEAVFGFCCNRLAARQPAVNETCTTCCVMSETPATALLAGSMNWAERDAVGASGIGAGSLLMILRAMARHAQTIARELIREPQTKV